MSVNLTKGQSVELAKEAPQVTKFVAGLGWDAADAGAKIDLDAVAILLGADGKALSDAHMVFYNNLKATGVEHTGDNLTGAGDGDDEQIKIDTAALEAGVEKIVLLINSFSGQKFGDVKNAFARLTKEDGTEVVKYDLGSEFQTEETVVMAELTKNGANWDFKAVGQGVADFKTAVAAYGINV